MLILGTNEDSQHFVRLDGYRKNPLCIAKVCENQAQADPEGMNKDIERNIDSYVISLLSLVTFQFRLMVQYEVSFE